MISIIQAGCKLTFSWTPWAVDHTPFVFIYAHQYRSTVCFHQTGVLIHLQQYTSNQAKPVTDSLVTFTPARRPRMCKGELCSHKPVWTVFIENTICLKERLCNSWNNGSIFLRRENKLCIFIAADRRQCCCPIWHQSPADLNSCGLQDDGKHCVADFLLNKQDAIYYNRVEY